MKENRNITQDKKMGQNKSWRPWMWGAMLLVAVALICVVVSVVQIYRQSGVEEQLEELQAQTVIKAEESGQEISEEPDYLQQLINAGVPIPDREIDFASRQADTNADIYAWIYIPDSAIDYPVLQHPTDNSYYLNYNLDGSKGYPGCIYSENYNVKDFSDPNTVLYGHNMKNGSMFAGLHEFADSTYFEEHPYIYIYTPEQLYVYQIFAAYEYSDAHLLLSFDFTDEEVYQSYLDAIWNHDGSNDNIREGVTVTVQDHILTLSTCVANQSSKRYLVQGMLLNG